MARAANTRKRQVAQPPAHRRWSGIFASGLVSMALAAAVLLGYRYLSEPGRMPLRVIDVNGEFQQLKPAKVQQVVVDAIDGGFFTCKMDGLRAAVLAMPWVEDVSIRRVWPDRLSMTVIEQVPLARWADDALINVNGGVFRPATLDQQHAGLVRLHGPDGSEQRVVAFFQAAVPAARSRGLRIRAVELDARRHWWVRFDGDLTLSLGREDVERRLAQFFRVYPRLAADPTRRPARVDMRYAHGFAVRWKTEPENAQRAVADALPQGTV
jgi:cell division protein FtsQ